MLARVPRLSAYFASLLAACGEELMRDNLETKQTLFSTRPRCDHLLHHAFNVPVRRNARPILISFVRRLEYISLQLKQHTVKLTTNATKQKKHASTCTAFTLNCKPLPREDKAKGENIKQGHLPSQKGVHPHAMLSCKPPIVVNKAKEQTV